MTHFVSPPEERVNVIQQLIINQPIVANTEVDCNALNQCASDIESLDPSSMRISAESPYKDKGGGNKI